MLEVRQSNRLDLLAENLVARLGDRVGYRHGDHSAEGLHVVLDRDVVVVQSPGMATWLRHRLAEAQGIAAGIDFPLPSSFVWQVLRALEADVPSESPFDKRLMLWHAFALLAPGGRLLLDPRAERLAGYLADDGDGMKRFQLSERIVDVFDQYLVYRPDWLARWRTGEEIVGVTRDEPWQPLFWRMLIERIEQSGPPGAGAQDRASLTARALGRLEREDCRARLAAAGLPGRIALFGISAMPPDQLRLLLALSAHVELTIHVLNPSRQYWSDIVSEAYLAQLEAAERVRDEAAPTHPYYEVGHPLLAELGGAGRDFVDLVLELGEGAVLEDDFREAAGPTALATLQRDILDLDPGAVPVALDPGDSSVLFLDCHGPLRELEVLRDRLLECFARSEALQPRDVVVMIPDIDRYAPYIEAVFGETRDGPVLPFAISDRGLGGETPVLATLAALLELPRSRFGASEVLALLETPAVLRACRIEAEMAERLGDWVRRAGVRWSLDDAHWRSLSLPAADEAAGVRAHSRAHSWSAGADRLLLGYAMGEAAPFEGRAPLPGVEGDLADAIGRLLAFVERLARHRERLAGPHPPVRWAQRIRALMADCFEEGADDTAALNGVREALVQLESRTARAGVDEALELDVVRELLAPALTARDGGHRFLGGQITFCTLMPMRTIPFRVVALLGMNDGDYPRRDVPLDFDLIPRHPRKGDRARRLEDRFLFLEALLAAREHLIVSWSGRDPVDDAERPPSVVVAALLEAVARRFRGPSGEPALEVLTQRHPLQPFSGAYDGERLRTSSSLWAFAKDVPAFSIARGTPGRVRFATRGDATMPSLRELEAFFVDPSGEMLRARLSVRLDVAELDVEDDEPFAIEGLDRHRLRAGAIEHVLAGGDVGSWIDARIAGGELPEGPARSAAVAALTSYADDYRARLAPLAGEVFDNVNVDCVLGNECLQGRVSDCSARVRLRVRPGKANERDRIRAWIAHLALSAQGTARTTVLLDESHLHLWPPLAAEAASGALEDLVRVRDEILDEPQPLLVATSAAFAEKSAKGEDAALDAARSAWRPNAFAPGRSEGEQDAVRRLWPEFPGDDAELAPTFGALALRVWGPLLTHGERIARAKTIDRLTALVEASEGDRGDAGA